MMITLITFLLNHLKPHPPLGRFFSNQPFQGQVEVSFLFKKGGYCLLPNRAEVYISFILVLYIVDVLWRQQIKLFQVVSASEFHEY